MLRYTIPLLLTLAASVHTRLARSEPAAGSVVLASPAELRLWFEGGFEAAFTQVTLRAGSGARLALGAPAVGAEEGLILVPVPLTLNAGRYTVGWETVGRDGHPVRGEFHFVLAGDDTLAGADAAIDSTAWGAGAAGRSPTGGPVVVGPDTEGSSTMSPAAWSRSTLPVRWGELASLIIALGSVGMLLLVLRTQRGSAAHERFLLAAVRRVRTVGLFATVAYAGFAAGRLALESQTMHGGRGGLTTEALMRTLGTGWGRAWLVGTAAMLVLLVAFVLRRRPASPDELHRTRPGNDLLLGAAALVAAAGPAITGHAAGAAAMVPLAVLTDWLHVVGASAWMGGVAALSLAAAPAALAQPQGERTPAMAWLLSSFHALATPAIALVALTGLVSAWLRVGSWAALMSTNYGELVLFKVYVVVFAAALGAYHWLRVHPRLAAAAASDDRDARRFGWTVYAELVLGLIVLALTAALVTTPPPM